MDKTAIQGSLDREITAFCHDSRDVRPGALFVALPGHRTDGNRFVQDAVAKGAVAVISQNACPPAPFTLPATWAQVPDAHRALGEAASRFYGEPSRALQVVGITGTNGKTTTSYFLESILAKAGRRAAVIGTVNYRLDGREIGKAVNTTPLASEVQRLFASARDAGADCVVMEVSSHALSLFRVEEALFDVAVFTNLSRDHLDFHKTREAYFEAKRHLFELLERGRSAKPRRWAVLNADDPWSAKLEGAAPHAGRLAYGQSKGCDWKASKIELSAAGTSFELRRGRKRRRVRLKLVGRYNVSNALAAAAAAHALGLSDDAIVEGLEALAAVPGRLEPVDAGQPFRVLVDYAHTDSALETVLANLQELPHGRIVTVFGCGGDRDRTKRGPMGVAACSRSDLAFVTSDNPRTEDPERILSDIVEGLKERRFTNYRVVPDRREAIGLAIAEARPGDIVLIAGKGHETAQILKDRTLHFDDRQVARELLAVKQAA